MGIDDQSANSTISIKAYLCHLIGLAMYKFIRTIIRHARSAYVPYLYLLSPICHELIYQFHLSLLKFA